MLPDFKPDVLGTDSEKLLILGVVLKDNESAGYLCKAADNAKVCWVSPEGMEDYILEKGETQILTRYSLFVTLAQENYNMECRDLYGERLICDYEDGFFPKRISYLSSGVDVKDVLPEVEVDEEELAFLSKIDKLFMELRSTMEKTHKRHKSRCKSDSVKK